MRRQHTCWYVPTSLYAAQTSCRTGAQSVQFLKTSAGVSVGVSNLPDLEWQWKMSQAISTVSCINLCTPRINNTLDTHVLRWCDSEELKQTSMSKWILSLDRVGCLRKRWKKSFFFSWILEHLYQVKLKFGLSINKIACSPLLKGLFNLWERFRNKRAHIKEG